MAKREISVFIDVENVMSIGEWTSRPSQLERLLESILETVGRLGYIIAELQGYASLKRSHGKVSVDKRRRLGKVFLKHSGRLFWSGVIADHSLMADIQQRLDHKTLPDTVAIVSGDGDFVPIIQSLKTAGHHVLISGFRGKMNAELRRTANQVVYLQLPFTPRWLE